MTLLFDILRRLAGRAGSGRDTDSPARERLRIDPGNGPIYVIGDVHGCLDLLLDLETRIETDATQFGSEALIVLAGDFVDRGPHSAQIIDYLLTRQKTGPRHITLAGNHETLMLGFLDAPERNGAWLEQGGRETLFSYGVDDLAPASPKRLQVQLQRAIPEEHRSFLASLPILVETPDYFVSHAGARPGVPLPEQSDEDLLWFRDGMASTYEGYRKTVVHGHQVVLQPFLSPRRINIDTGAYATGRLSAVRLHRDGPPFVISAGVPASSERL